MFDVTPPANIWRGVSVYGIYFHAHAPIPTLILGHMNIPRNLSSVGIIVVTGIILSGCSPATSDNTQIPHTNPPGAAEPVMASPVIKTPKNVVKVDWRYADTEDYRQYISQLRTNGVPEDQVRALALADVNRLFQTRLNNLAATVPSVPFWQTESPATATSAYIPPDKLKEQASLLQQRKEVLARLAVPEPQGVSGVTPVLDPLNQMLSFVPLAKRKQIAAVEQKFQSALNQNLPAANATPEQIAAYEETLRQRDLELSALLTPQEKEEYDLRRSRTANQLRSALTGFNPTEQEFRILFQLTKQYENQLGSLSGLAATNPAVQQQREAAQQMMETQLKSMLSEERYRDYQRSQDPKFKGLYDFAQRQKLPADSATWVYDTQNKVQNQIQKLTEDANLSDTARQEQLKELQAKTESELLDKLGTNAFNRYRNTSLGQWLIQLTPNP